MPSTSTQKTDCGVDRWSDTFFNSAVSAQITPITSRQHGRSSYNS